MFKSCLFATFLFFLAWDGVDAQLDFFTNMLNKLPAYVKENGLDPSEIYTEPFIIRRRNDIAEFRNHQLFGHSEANSTVDFVRFRLPTDIRLGYLHLDITFGDPNTTIEGDYTINGRLDNNETYYGEGRWLISPRFYFYLIIYLDDIPLSQDGSYLDLKNSGSKYITIWNATVDQMDYKMEGLVAGGHEELITIDNMREMYHQFSYNGDLVTSPYQNKLYGFLRMNLRKFLLPT